MNTPEDNPGELLTTDDLGRLFDVTVKAGDPELITDIIMPAYHLREARTKPIDQELELVMYDADWKKLRERGEPEPIESDPRLAMDDMEFFGLYNLKPSYLFKPRSEIIAMAQAHRAQSVVELEDETLTTYSKLSEVVDESDVAFILSLAGISISTEGIEFREINAERLKQVRKVVMLMDPVMRDIIRANMHIVGVVEPDLAEQLRGTPMDDPENEVLLKLREAAEALISEWSVDPED